MAAQPDLGIEDPYSLNQDQFDAAVALLKDQHGMIGEYWNDYTKAQAAFESGSTVLGTTWQVIYNLAVANNAKLATVYPKEGATGWSDTWMISSEAAHPNCMYKWMDYITSPEVQAQVAYYFGEAPANPKACDLITDDPTHCDVFKAERRRLRRGGPLLGHAAQGVPRRVGRRLRAVLRVDQGLDGDQGLSELWWGAREGAPPTLHAMDEQSTRQHGARGPVALGVALAARPPDASRSRRWPARRRCGWRCSTPGRCCRCSSRRCTR